MLLAPASNIRSTHNYYCLDILDSGTKISFNKNFMSKPWCYTINKPEYVIIHDPLLHKQNV